MEAAWSASRHGPFTPQERGPVSDWIMRLGGPQTRSGCLADLLNLPGFETQNRLARCLVTIPTILSRLEHCDCIFNFVILRHLWQKYSFQDKYQKLQGGTQLHKHKNKVPIHAMKELWGVKLHSYSTSTLVNITLQKQTRCREENCALLRCYAASNGTT